jgi:hypothetical protein
VWHANGAVEDSPIMRRFVTLNAFENAFKGLHRR